MGAKPSFGHVGGEFFERAAALSWPSVVQHNRVRMNAILANMVATPLEKMSDGKVGLLKPSDVAKLASPSMRSVVNDIEDMMTQGRAIITNNGLDLDEYLDILCLFYARMICFALKKGKASREGVDHKSLGECADIFINQIDKRCGTAVDNPWKHRTRLIDKTSSEEGMG